MERIEGDDDEIATEMVWLDLLLILSVGRCCLRILRDEHKVCGLSTVLPEISSCRTCCKLFRNRSLPW